MVPISRGMTSKGKTPLSPTMREPKREQIQVSSRSPLSRAPQDSLSLLSRRQAVAAPRLRRAGWEPPALSKSSRARTVRKRSLWPAIPQPGQGHPGMPGARKHKDCSCELPPWTTHPTLPALNWPWHHTPARSAEETIPRVGAQSTLCPFILLPRTTHFFLLSWLQPMCQCVRLRPNFP